MKRAVALLCMVGAATSVVYGQEVQTGHFAFQGGKEVTNGYLSMKGVSGDPLRKSIDIWMTPTNSTRPIREYAVEMTKKLHVVAVSKDFSTFLHVHPALGADGHFRIVQQFPKEGTYYLYADGEPNGGDHQVYRFDLAVGKPVEQKAPDLTPTGREVNVGPYTVDLSDVMLTAGGMDMIHIQILKGNEPAKDLHPYLGSPAHAIFLNSKDLSYVHVHPSAMNMAMPNMKTTSPAKMHQMMVEMPDSANSPSEMMLHVSVEELGTYKLWLQFRGGDQLYIAPFILQAK